jgi:DNA (cytosine-5)-methyltransferase 1
MLRAHPCSSLPVSGGSFFGLDVRRHRLFETNWPLMSTPCSHHWQQPRFRSLDRRQKDLASVVGVHGHLNYAGERELRERAMGISWMNPHELVEAIPPAYTELIGHQLMQHVTQLTA